MMTRKFLTVSVALLTLATLSSCGSTGVFDRDRPDEFAVTRAAPLTVPADLSALPQPQPGSVPAREGESKAAVLDAMFGAPK
jgi:uncharacterized lipoprotein